MGSRIRLALFDNCTVRRTVLAHLLQTSGRYHVAFQRQIHPGGVADLSLAAVDGTLLTAGENESHEWALIADLRTYLGRRPVLAYALNSDAYAVFQGLSQVGGGGARAERSRPDACLAPLDDTNQFLDSLAQHLTALSVGPIAARNSTKPGIANEDLTPRERQILGLLAEGLSCKAIAVDLRISVQTVYTYTNRIRLRFRLTSTAQLFSLAFRTKIAAGVQAKACNKIM